MNSEKPWQEAWELRVAEILAEHEKALSPHIDSGNGWVGTELESLRIDYGTPTGLLPAPKAIASAYERILQELEACCVEPRGGTRGKAWLYLHPSALFALNYCSIELREPSTEVFDNLAIIDEVRMNSDLLIVADQLGYYNRSVFIPPAFVRGEGAARVYDTLRKGGATMQEAAASCTEVAAAKQGRKIQ